MLLFWGVMGSAFAQLPSVKLKDINGKVVDTATLSNDGKPFIISFFATWCKPCNRELKAINEVYPDWQDETGVRVIAVSIDEAQNAQKVKPMVDAAPKQISCRAVRLKATLDFTLLKSRGTEIYAAKKTPPISGHPVCSWPQNWS